MNIRFQLRTFENQVSFFFTSLHLILSGHASAAASFRSEPISSFHLWCKYFWVASHPSASSWSSFAFLQPPLHSFQWPITHAWLLSQKPLVQSAQMRMFSVLLQMRHSWAAQSCGPLWATSLECECDTPGRRLLGKLWGRFVASVVCCTT